MVGVLLEYLDPITTVMEEEIVEPSEEVEEVAGACGLNKEERKKLLRLVIGDVKFAALELHELMGSPFDEKVARFYMGNVLLGLEHLHAEGVVYAAFVHVLPPQIASHKVQGRTRTQRRAPVR